MKAALLISIISTISLSSYGQVSAEPKTVEQAKHYSQIKPTYFAVELKPGMKIPDGAVTVTCTDLLKLVKTVEGATHKPVKLKYCFFKFVDKDKNCGNDMVHIIDKSDYHTLLANMPDPLADVVSVPAVPIKTGSTELKNAVEIWGVDLNRALDQFKKTNPQGMKLKYCYFKNVDPAKHSGHDTIYLIDANDYKMLTDKKRKS